MKRSIANRACGVIGCAMAAILVIGNVRGISGLGAKGSVIEPVTIYAENSNAAGHNLPVENKETREISNKIAIVNLDEGVMSNGKKTIYASQIITIPENGDLEPTSLSAAQAGLDSGKYGAYIVIPETFSRTVVSINGTPEKCNLSYAINRNASAGAQYEIVHKVLQFIDGLNDDLSYIYLENILSEYHSAQDTAGTVMGNDLKDKEAIDGIKAGDLISAVQIPALESVQNDVKPLDIDTYAEQDTTIVTEIGNAYTTSITEAQGQLTALREEGSTLQDTLSTNAQNSDSTLEGLQKIDISGSMTDARAVIENSEAADREETRSLIESVNSTGKNVDSLVEDISEAVAKSSRKAQESTRQSIKGIIESVISDIPDVPRIEVTDAGDDGQVTIALNDGEEGQDDGEEAQTESGPAIRLSLVDADPEEVQKADNNMNLLMTISGSMAGAYYGTQEKTISQYPVHIWADSYKLAEPEQTGVDTNTDEGETFPDGEENNSEAGGGGPQYIYQEYIDDTVDVVYTENLSVHDVFDELDSDENIQTMLGEAGYSTCQEFMDAVSKGEVIFSAGKRVQLDSTPEEVEAFNEALNDLHKIDINEKFSEDAIQKIAADTKLPDVSAYRYDENDNLVVDENNIPETLYGSTGESIKGSLSAAQQVLTDGFENRSAGIYSAETGVINGTLNAIESAVNGLNDNVEETRKAVSGNYSGSTAALTEYGTKLGTFTPVLDSTAVNENVSKMNTNYSALQQEVLENNQSYQNYVNKVYETTDNNISTIRQSITDAQAIAENTVKEGLNNAKSVKSETSAENQQLLAEFSRKLPYTRLGTLENTVTYEFIANPIESTDTSPEAKISNNDNYAAPTQATGQDVVANSIGGGSSSGSSTSFGSNKAASSANPAVPATVASAETDGYVMPFIVLGAAAVALAAFFGIRQYMKKNERY